MSRMTERMPFPDLEGYRVRARRAALGERNSERGVYPSTLARSSSSRYRSGLADGDYGNVTDAIIDPYYGGYTSPYKQDPNLLPANQDAARAAAQAIADAAAAKAASDAAAAAAAAHLAAMQQQIDAATAAIATHAQMSIQLPDNTAAIAAANVAANQAIADAQARANAAQTAANNAIAAANAAAQQAIATNDQAAYNAAQIALGNAQRQAQLVAQSAASAGLSTTQGYVDGAGTAGGGALLDPSSVMTPYAGVPSGSGVIFGDLKSPVLWAAGALALVLVLRR